MRNIFVKSLAVTLMVAIAMPAALFAVPSRVHAQSIPEGIGCVGGLVGTVLSVVQGLVTVPDSDVVDQLFNNIGGGASVFSCVYESVIVPGMRLIIRNVIRSMTASVINWINGTNNGTGKPSFVGDLKANLQLVGDIQALSFFAQFARNSNSPFASSIIASLRTSYLQNTSAAGFWAANRSTLAQYSPNVNSFLAGNWSQGGVAAWLALTTQQQNNPYLLFQASQSQLGSLVASAQAVRTTALNWGQGFLSWCGPIDTTADTESMDVARTDSCINSDGTSGTIRTPGSVIHDYTNKFVVSIGAEGLVNAQDLDSAFNAIFTAILNRVLGGVGQGLLGTGGAGGPVTSPLRNPPPTPSSSATVDDVITRVNTYITAWTTIQSSANGAEAAVTKAVQMCGSGNYAAMLQAAVPLITKVQTDAETALASAATTKTFALQVKGEASSGSGAYAANLVKLLAMPPTPVQVLEAEGLAKATGRATAAPAGSMNISGGTPVDQMTLIAQNAAGFESKCSATTI